MAGLFEYGKIISGLYLYIANGRPKTRKHKAKYLPVPLFTEEVDNIITTLTYHVIERSEIAPALEFGAHYAEVVKKAIVKHGSSLT